MWMNARNRVWVARRNLPQPIRAVYLINWWLISMARLYRDRTTRTEWLQGWRAGKTTQSKTSAPQLSWRTVLRLALRSEEHTSELQSRGHLVCRLLLEKKKKT